MDGESSYGFSHLSEHPITLTYGALLIGVLLLLVLLRVVFGSISVSGGAR